MSTPSPLYFIPYGTTDKQLVEFLKKLLPDLLAKKMNISREQAEQGAEALAERIVHTAQRCNQVHLVPDVANKIYLNTPSKEECEDFKTALDELIVIRYGEMWPRNKVWDAAEKLWFHLIHRVLGIDMDKGPEKWIREAPNAAGVMRG
jgi:hypothetical protein